MGEVMDTLNEKGLSELGASALKLMGGWEVGPKSL